MMHSFSLFGRRPRGEAAQGISPELHHHLGDHHDQPRRHGRPKASTPVRERIRSGLKEYDTSFRKFIAQKLNDSSRREKSGLDEMPSATHDAPGSRLSTCSVDSSTVPLQSPFQSPFGHAMVDAAPSEPAGSITTSREDSWSTDDMSIKLQLEQGPSFDTRRHSIPMSRSRSMSIASNRLSQTIKSPTRLSKRYSHSSTIRSSFTPSIWSNRLSTSSTSTLSSNVTAYAEVATPGAPHELRESKKLRHSYSSSRTDLEPYIVNSQRQSLEEGYLSGGDINLLREAISPSPHNAPHNAYPKLIIPKSAPDSVENQMEVLSIHDPDSEEPPNSGKALSIISEADTDVSHNVYESQMSPDGFLIPRSPIFHPESRSISSKPSDNALFSPPAAAPTPDTSLDLSDHDGDQELDEDSLSEGSEVTDGSFIEAFNATSLHPDMLPQVLMLRRQVMSIVESSVIEWMRSCPSGSWQPSGSPSGASGSSNSNTPGSQGGRGTKRGFDDDQSNNNTPGGGGDGDEDPKRRKTTPHPDDQTVKGPPLACPFVKRYPEHEWPNVCQTGFLTVSRLKEHIYRKHTPPPQCGRCFEEFKNKDELDGHHQMEKSCDRAPRPPAVIGRISDETKTRLKSRRGIQNLPEDSKWNGVYQILFPGKPLPLRPYVDNGPLDQRTVEELNQFRQQSERMIGERLRMMPVSDEVTQLMIRTVVDVFDLLRPDPARTPAVHSETHDEAEEEDGEGEEADVLHQPLAKDQPLIFSGSQFADALPQGDRHDPAQAPENHPAALDDNGYGALYSQPFQSIYGNGLNLGDDVTFQFFDFNGGQYGHSQQ